MSRKALQYNNKTKIIIYRRVDDMTIKERIIDELKGIEFGNDFLNAVFTKKLNKCSIDI